MLNRHFVLILLVMSFLNLAQAQVTFGLGSCNKQWRDQKYWQHIQKKNLDLWVWLGDVIYADHAPVVKRAKFYHQQKNSPSYKKLRESTPVVGTWDDHDYAYNNAGHDYPLKKQSKSLFLNFLDVQRGDPVWKRNGIYRKVEFNKNGISVDLFLLDNRSFYNYKKGVLLGEKQWEWLEQGILDSQSDIVLVASGIIFLSDFTWPFVGLEGWAMFSKERERLFSILEKAQTPILLLSGDRHASEISKRKLRNGKWIYEVMASGLTHGARITVPNKYRIGKYIGYPNYVTLTLSEEAEKIKADVQIFSTKDGSRGHQAILSL